MVCRFVHLVFGLLLVFAFTSLSDSLASPIETTIEKILSNKDAYHDREVTVLGKATTLKSKVSRKGNPYTTFRLSDVSGKSVSVYVRGKAEVAEGQGVRVTGTYQREKQVGRHTFYNEIEAIEIKVKSSKR